MVKIKRTEMKKIVNKTIMNSMMSLYNGKYCNDRQLTFTIKRYINNGMSLVIDNYNLTIRINVYLNGEVKYKLRNIFETVENIVIEANKEYDDIQVHNDLKDMIKDIKLFVKETFDYNSKQDKLMLL